MKINIGNISPPQDHRIGDISALELVEAKHASSLGDIRSNHRQCIKVVAILDLNNMHALMHILHEVVEMNAGLGLNIGRQGIEEQIHKHGLSTPNIAKHVQTLGKRFGNRRFWRFFATTFEQRGKERRFSFGVQGLNGGMNDGGRGISFQSLK